MNRKNLLLLFCIVIMGVCSCQTNPAWYSTYGIESTKELKEYPAVDKLERALEDKNANVRLQATIYLAEFGPEAEEAVPVLADNLVDFDYHVSFETIRTLGKIGPKAKKAVPQLIKKLACDNHKIKMEIMKTLILIGTEAQEAIPKLIEIVDVENFEERVEPEGLDYLKKYQPQGLKAMSQAIRKALDDKEQIIRNKAMEVLKKIKDEDDIATQVIIYIHQLESTQIDEIVSAAQSLGDLGPQALKALPALTIMILNPHNWSHDYWRVRREIATTIGKFGKDGQAALPALIETINDFDFGVRIEIIKSLTKIAPGNPAVVAALITLLDDWNPRVREKATKTLVEIGAF